MPKQGEEKKLKKKRADINEIKKRKSIETINKTKAGSLKRSIKLISLKLLVTKPLHLQYRQCGFDPWLGN